MSNRIQHQFGSAMNVESIHQVRAMDGNSVHAQAQQRGNLFIRITLGNQLQNLLFPLR